MDTKNQYSICKSLEDTMNQLSGHHDAFFATQTMLNAELQRLIDPRESDWTKLSKLEILHVLTMCGKNRPSALHSIFIAISMHYDNALEAYQERYMDEASEARWEHNTKRAESGFAD